jgi:hypothetical protein
MNEPVKHATEFLGAELVAEFLDTLGGRSASTRAVYGRTLYRLAAWIAECPGAGGVFCPVDFTHTALTTYLDELADQGLSLSHRTRVRIVAGRCARIKQRQLPDCLIIVKPATQTAGTGRSCVTTGPSGLSADRGDPGPIHRGKHS